MAIKKSNKEFISVAGQRLSVSSRLNIFNILLDTKDNVYFLNIFKSFIMDNKVKENNIFFDIYLAEEDEWWDNISYKYYQSERLWWLICLMNDIVNPFEELEAGQQIKILKEGYLYNVFKNLQEIASL